MNTVSNQAVNSSSEVTLPQSFWQQRTWQDGLFFLALLCGAGWTLRQYGARMDVYEISILLGLLPALAWMSWQWRPLQGFFLLLAACSLLAVGAYDHSLANAEKNFFLKYLFASQPAILWMCLLFCLANLAYWVGLLSRAQTASWLGSSLTWAAVLLGSVGLMVRWYESYLISPDVGHIPVSNLYEVFILFALITALFYLYYEARYQVHHLGAFVLMVIVAAVGFLVWYTVERNAHEIQPLVPALQSWWMKIHVPANFIGYGTFSLAAMVAFAYLLKQAGTTNNPWKIVPLFVLGTLLAAEPLVFRKSGLPTYWAMYFAVAALVVGVILLLRRRIAEVLPDNEILEDIMYKAIAIGFAFFTIATILGALWAADAWGTYWQWDPKETWALIVWLNYAAWLHMRLMKGLRGSFAAYWALVGLLITGFAFLGVNMFLSGLHSYGEL